MEKLRLRREVLGVVFIWGKGSDAIRPVVALLSAPSNRCVELYLLGELTPFLFVVEWLGSWLVMLGLWWLGRVAWVALMAVVVAWWHGGSGSLGSWLGRGG